MAIAWTFALCVQHSVAAPALVTLADSVADFSNTQGYRNWQYGYIDTASGPSFVPFTIFQSNYPDSNPNGSPAWVADTLPANSYLFTALWASGGMDNGLQSSFISREQFDDRRWVSNINATVTISGQFGNPGAPLIQQDGINALILVNGTPIWSLNSSGYIPVAPYSVSTTLSVGAIVDFVVEPHANDYADEHTFTALIQTPAPVGDVNLDGIVNSQDIAVVSSNWLNAGTGIAADVNGDGIVNAQDLALISSNWMAQIGTPSPVQVPEPTTIALLALGAALGRLFPIGCKRRAP